MVVVGIVMLMGVLGAAVRLMCERDWGQEGVEEGMRRVRLQRDFQLQYINYCDSTFKARFQDSKAALGSVCD